MAKKPIAVQTISGAGEKQDYVVTETAPPRVAGRRVQKGETISLTEAEARAELQAVHIRPKTTPET